jgi:hypothetical protein
MRAVDAMASADQFGFVPEPLGSLLADTARHIRETIDLTRGGEPDAAGMLVLASLFVGALRMAPAAHAAEMRSKVDSLAGSLGHLIGPGPLGAAEFVLGILDGKTGAPPDVAALTAIAAVCRAVDDSGCLPLLLEGFRTQGTMAEA